MFKEIICMCTMKKVVPRAHSGLVPPPPGRKPPLPISHIAVLAIMAAVMLFVSPVQAATAGYATGTATPPVTLEPPVKDYKFIEPDSATDTEPGNMAITPVDTAGLVEKTGAVIKVSGLDKVYVDQGEIQGVKPDMPMIVYRMEPIRNMAGEVLDEEERVIGKLRIYEVRPRLSIGNVIQSSEDMKRGLFVRYWVEEERAVTAGDDKRCPKGMMFDGGGPFVFLPGNYFRSTPVTEKQTKQTEAFCIDKRPSKDVVTWAAATEACRSQGKRLCAKEEKQKVCVTWDKPPACSPEQQQAAECPEPNTIIGFSRDQEWTADLVDKDGEPFMDANSCSCPGASPVCVHCYFDQCRGAKKIFRCCSEPFKVEKSGK